MNKKFNQAQEEAIRHKEGPMMVLAGPGSGKTTVICERVAHLIEKGGVNPASILVVTFTKAAAQEMKSRFFSRMGNTHMPVSFGTFHSIFFAILKAAYNYQTSDIVTDHRRLDIFKEIVDELQLELDDETDFISGVAAEVSLVKGENINTAYYYSSNCGEDIFRSIYDMYNKKLRAMKQIDFDDMLIYTLELFQKRSDILKAWQNKFQYILIDEFQDINRIQYEIIRMLAAPRNNLFIVGDDDQSIYRFRGAKPEIMLNFMKDYPKAGQILLDVNYRCTQSIVDGALRVVKNNKKRYVKDLKAHRGGSDSVEVKMFNTMHEEYDTLIKTVVNLHKTKQIPLSEMAVLFRTNTGARLLIAKLMEYNIPFRMRDSLPNLFEHWITKDIIAYIKAALGIAIRGDYLRIINRPKRFIARQYLGSGEISVELLKERHKGKEWAIEKLDKLSYDLKSIRDMTPYAAINYIRYAVGYDAWLMDYAKERRMKEDELLDVVTELQESAKDFPSFDEWFIYMEEYGKKLALIAKHRESFDRDCLALSTMHSAKGLEYKVVFMIDANEEVTPHKKAVMEDDLEEERRMFYVAMTRAKDLLYIYFSKERYHKPSVMSRFVGEFLLDRDCFAEGTKVCHKVYGVGTIVKVTQTSVSILFTQSKEIKTLNIAFCIENHMISLC